MEKALIIRIFIVIFLTVVVVLLFFTDKINESNLKQPTLPSVQPDYTMAEVDSAVVKVLEKFQVDKSWIKRTEISTAGFATKRIELRVMIPPEINPALVNVELKRMAENYNLQVSATENLKENMVTIHIHENRKIIETIILKITQKKQQGKEKPYQRRKI